MEISDLLSSIINFFLYFGVSLILLIAFKFIYPLVTPQDEWNLIKSNKNTAAAVALGGAILGFSIALSGAVANSVDLIDYIIWALIGLVTQLLAFVVIRLIFMPKIVNRIEEGEVSAGIIVAVFSVAVGILKAACRTY